VNNIKLKINVIYISLVLVLTISSCSSYLTSGNTFVMPHELYRIPENCDFTKIKAAHIGENECSPVLLDPYFGEFSGLLINGPKKVFWPDNVIIDDIPPNPFGQSSGALRLMLAGLIRLKYNTLGLNGEFSQHVMLVAVNQKTAKTYSGKMPVQNSIPEPVSMDAIDDIEMPDETLNSLVRSYFNFDLVQDLGLPISDV